MANDGDPPIGGPQPHPHDPWIGRCLGPEGRYRIDRRLGEGGFGTAFLATDLHFAATTGEARKVVVKVPHAERTGTGPDALPKDFLKEAAALTRLQHAHVLKVLDVGVDPTPWTPFLVLEHAVGGSLDDVLARAGGRQTVAEVMRWLPDVARALDHVHGRGVLHRDVKPSNILFDESGAALLADFGIVKIFGSTSRTGNLPGSPLYMGPEAMLSRDLDGRYDQYALAATVYEALSGRFPVEPEEWTEGGERDVSPITAQRLLYRKTSEAPVPLRARRSDLPAAVSDVLDRALSKDREARFPTCVAFADALRDAARRVPPTVGVADRGGPSTVADGPPVRSAPTSPRGPRPPRAPASRLDHDEPPRPRGGPRRRPRAPWLAVAGFLVVAGTVVAVALSRREDGGGARNLAADALRIEAPAEGALVSTRTVAVRVHADLPPDARVVVGGTLVTAQGRRAIDGVEGVRDGASVVATVTAPDDGALSLVARLAGAGPSPIEARRDVVLDSVPPTVTLVEPADGEARLPADAGTTTIRWTVADAHLAAVTVEGAPVTPGGDGAYEQVVAVAPGATKTVTIGATDRAGHASPAVVVRLTRTDAAPVPPPPAPPAWRADLDVAVEKGLAGDLRTAAKAWDDATAQGMRESDAPAGIAALVRAWKAPPDLGVDAPADEASLTTPLVTVKGVLRSGRATDEVHVDGTRVRTGPGPFESTVTLAAAGAHRIVVEVKDAGVRRGTAVERQVTWVGEPWRAFLSGWAEPVGDARDGASGFPARIRRTKDGAEMVLVPGGPFWMQRVAARPQAFAPQGEEPAEYVRVTIPRPYYLDVHEVSAEQFARFAGDTGFVTDVEKRGGTGWNEGGPTAKPRPGEFVSTWRTPWPPATVKAAIADASRHPVIKVSWDDATAFSAWAGVTLPTEAQFERALRADREKTKYPWGESAYPATVVENLRDVTHLTFRRNDVPGLDPATVRYDDGFALTAPVASFPPNAFGVCDLAGNAIEWCLDVLDPASQTAASGPVGSLTGVADPNGTLHAMRGGDWGWGEPYAGARALGAGEGWSQGIGFRCARELPSGRDGAAAAPPPRDADTPADEPAVVAWSEPDDGTTTSESSLRVRGTLVRGRATDVVTVNGTRARTGPGPFDVEVELPGDGPHPITVSVANGGERRTDPIVRVVRRVPGPAWPTEALAFLADWAVPVGAAKDDVTGYPRRIRRTKDGAEMVLIPAGSFHMGRVPQDPVRHSIEEPAHRVTLTRAYYLDVYEITNERFARFASDPDRPAAPREVVGAWRATVPGVGDPLQEGLRHPVTRLFSHEAEAYAAWARVELPTEAQFERALRGPRDAAVFPWGDSTTEGVRAANVLSTEFLSLVLTDFALPLLRAIDVGGATRASVDAAIAEIRDGAATTIARGGTPPDLDAALRAIERLAADGTPLLRGATVDPSVATSSPDGRAFPGIWLSALRRFMADRSRLPLPSDGYATLAPVGSFEADDWGVFDLDGNVEEIVRDFRAPYPSTPAVDPVAVTDEDKSWASCSYRGGAFLRGLAARRCSWRYNACLAKFPKVASTYDQPHALLYVGDFGNLRGFRCAKTLPASSGR